MAARNDEAEFKEIPICFDGAPRHVLERMGRKAGWFTVDHSGHQFPDNDALFTYFSTARAPSSHATGPAFGREEAREVTKPADKREEVVIWFGDASQVFKKNDCKTYTEAVMSAKRAVGIPDSWQIACVRA
jgi:hypothetical protein